MRTRIVEVLERITPRDGRNTSDRTSTLRARFVEYDALATVISREIAELRAQMVSLDTSEYDGAVVNRIERMKRIVSAMELQVAEMGRSVKAASAYSHLLDQCAILAWADLGIDRPDSQDESPCQHNSVDCSQ